MKEKLICLWILLSGQVSARSMIACDSTLYDTIYVSHVATTYLLFPEAVELVDIGSGEGYVAKIEGKSVFIRATHKDAPLTNFLIKHGESYYTGMLGYAGIPGQYLYDFRKTTPVLNQIPDHAEQQSVDVKAIKGRLQQLGQLSSDHVVRSRRKDNIQVSLSEIVIDHQVLYLKVGVHNHSSMDYTIDFVRFERIEHRGKRFSSNNQSTQTTAPLLGIGSNKIPAHGTTTLLYALPLYAMRKRSKLLITIKEVAGARVLRLSLPARLIAKANRID